MKALVCKRYTHWRNLEIDDWAPGQCEPGDVRVRVEAAGVSFASILAIAGKHQNRSEPPFVPGTEAVGVVEEVGDDVQRVSAGDRVAVITRNGALAQELVVSEHAVFALPDQIGTPEAVALPSIYATAWIALSHEARLMEDETLLVHGSGGATGHAAVQLGVAMGATVIATASSPAKRNAATEAGASVTCDSRNFRERVLEVTEGRGVDVVFDPVGGAVFDESLRSVAPEGRVLTIGFASGTIPQIPSNIVLVKNISIIGVNWGYYVGWSEKQPTETAKAAVADAFHALHTLAADGDINPLVHGVYAFDDFETAFGEVDSRNAIGKVVLTF